MRSPPLPGAGERAPFRILTGIECDIDVDGGLDPTDELLGWTGSE